MKTKAEILAEYGIKSALVKEKKPTIIMKFPVDRVIKRS